MQPNVLIDAEGNPRLMDFGCSSITRNVWSANASTPHGGGSIRWSAPELVPLSTDLTDLERVRSTRPTNESDVYSLAMVTIEVIFFCLAQNLVSHSFGHLQIFTGNWPFAPYGDEQVILLLAKDMRPDKPTHGKFTPKMWSLTKKCWNKDPKKRPSVSEVLRNLESREGGFSSFMQIIVSCSGTIQ